MVAPALLVAGATGFVSVAYQYVFPTSPICVVGAGPAGLATAAGLEQKGHNVVMFEKQAAVGGKCQSIYEHDSFVPLGAFIFSNVTYRETLKLMNQTGVASVPFNSGHHWDFDLETGHVSTAHGLPPQFQQLLMQEFKRYSIWYQTVFAKYDLESGYSNGIPSELLVSTAEWLASNGYKALPALFKGAMVAYGYGDYREVPIIYMLQYLAPDVAAVVLRISIGQEIQIVDFNKVLSLYAEKSVKGPVHLDTEISEIDRTGTKPVITYRKANTPKSSTQKCSSVVLAFPPTLNTLNAANLVLTPEELDVFGRVGISDYWTAAVRTHMPNEMTFIPKTSSPMLPPAAAGHPVVMTKLASKSNISTVGSWDALHTNVSDSEVYSILKATVSSINKDPRDESQTSEPVSDADVLDFQRSIYFPHFGSDDLRTDTYAKLHALQGKNNTYYVSGLNIMELVEYALRAGQNLVETYF